jgi:hypothetical protein
MDAKALPTTTPPTPAQMRPADFARAINDKLSQMVSAARTSFTRAIEIGELLKQAKDRVGHGNFEAWVNDNCKLSYRSARRYMKLADDRPKIEEQLRLEAPGKMANVANLNVATAQRLLAPLKTPSDKPKPPVIEQYKQIENDLIACLKDLREKAESYVHHVVHVCENCGREYLPERERQDGARLSAEFHEAFQDWCRDNDRSDLIRTSKSRLIQEVNKIPEWKHLKASRAEAEDNSKKPRRYPGIRPR